MENFIEEKKEKKKEKGMWLPSLLTMTHNKCYVYCLLNKRRHMSNC